MEQDTKNEHNKKTGSKIERSDERIAITQEVFTHIELCREMVERLPLEMRKNPDSKFLDNSAGSGNFLVALRDELIKYHDLDHVLDNMLYCVELMEDNHKELCERLDVPVDHPHYVCHDALTYDYGFGEPVGVEQFFT